MTPHTIPQTVLFPDLFDKPLVATFNQEHASSDGGAVLLKAAERVYGVFVYRVEARKSAKWCAGLVRMCRYVQYGSRGRQTGRFEGARARG